MWRDLISWIRLLWDTGSQTEKNTSDITDLMESDARQLSSIEKLQTQREHDREMAERRVQMAEARIGVLEKEIELLRRELQMAQENSELKLRLALSEYLRQLPPPEQKPNNEEKP